MVIAGDIWRQIYYLFRMSPFMTDMINEQELWIKYRDLT